MKNKNVSIYDAGSHDRCHLRGADLHLRTHFLRGDTGADRRGADHPSPVYAGCIPGLFIGCLLGNIVGGALLPDIIFGSLATLIGAVFTWLLRSRKPIIGTLPPIISNVVIVPLVLRIAYGVNLPIPFLMLTVGIGEVISCTILGLIVYYALNRYRNTLFPKAAAM